MTTTPMFRHDCQRCRYLGSDNQHDHYVCESDSNLDMRSLVARYSSDGPDYISAPTSMVRRYKPVDHDYVLLKTLMLLERQP